MRIADALVEARGEIAAANAEDVAQAERDGLPAPLVKRLAMDEAKVEAAAAGVRSVARLPDPVGAALHESELADGLTLRKVTCPIGVIGVIFESRPDALVQISALCLKSGNAALLKGGSEARHTNRALYNIIVGAGAGDMPQGWLALLETRGEIDAILGLDGEIDLIIPRGSNAFVRYIMDHTRIPVLGHADGICHCYVDRAADTAMAVRIAVDAKTQYVAVCNAMETLLVHSEAAAAFLPAAQAALAAKGVELRGCARARAYADMKPAEDSDWDAEYLDYVLSVKVVDSLDEAVAHINRHGSRHTDAIVTADESAARRFMLLVDAANVYHNCSTRFSDGFRYGFGAEVGVATGKLHPRGPVGLDGLVTYKYMLSGSGDIVADFEEGRRRFKHADA